MASAENKIMRQRLATAWLSSVLSISLVLLLVGIASLLLVNAGNVSDYFKEHMQITVIFKQEVSDNDARAFTAKLERKDYIKSIEYVSKEQGIYEMQELLGKDFLSVFDTAPIPISLNVTLRAEYLDTEKIEAVMEELQGERLVDSVNWQKSLIETLNANLRRISFILSIFIILLLVISFALINNTIRLDLYSKRFSIHTMRLVGATKAFIIKPFLAESIFQGVISSLLAIIMMLCILLFVKKEFVQMFTIFQLKQLLTVMVIIIGAGIVICMVATVFVVNRLVTLKKEELYY